MPVSVKTLRSTLYTFVPVICALLIAASVHLQLFQDGSSYLFEVLESNSAIRHDRFSVMLLQAPVMAARRVLARLDADPNTRLQVTRIAFSLSYAIVPFVALALSWLVTRRRNGHLFVWAALIILFVNLVNFSWVSELLIALQLACPLLIVSANPSGTRTYWAFVILLSAFIFFLHPLIVPLFVALSAGSLYATYRRGNLQAAALLTPIFFFAVAAAKGIMSLFALTPYETSFLEPQGMSEYLIETSVENIVFLAMALAIGSLCLFGARLAKKARWRISWVYTCCIALAVAGGALLAIQYRFSGEGFPLKTGLALFTAIVIAVMAYVDSCKNVSPAEEALRQKLVLTFAMVFALVIISKSLIWHSSVQMLEASLARSQESCSDVVSTEFSWVKQSPHNIIDNWALPSLALVMQDSEPRRLLLDNGNCKQFYETGMVQIDPWTNMPQELLVPRLN